MHTGRVIAAPRTDAEIRHDVTLRMREDFDVPDDHLRVTVEDGIVTIIGAVAHEVQRDAAEACARRVCGVRGVVNRIDVYRTSAMSD